MSRGIFRVFGRLCYVGEDFRRVYGDKGWLVIDFF